MAFTTIPGSGSNATTLSGSSGVDSVAISSESNLFVGAQKSADSISFSGSATRSNLTIKGGRGADTVAFNSNTLSNSFLNGNKDADTFGGATDRARLTTSTTQGGWGVDSIFLNTASESIVNGNKQADTINFTGAASSSQIRGGADNDTITIGNAQLTSTLVNGDKGDDSITLAILAGTEGFLQQLHRSGCEGNDSVDATQSTTALLMAGGSGGDSVTELEQTLTP